MLPRAFTSNADTPNEGAELDNVDVDDENVSTLK